MASSVPHGLVVGRLLTLGGDDFPVRSDRRSRVQAADDVDVVFEPTVPIAFMQSGTVQPITFIYDRLVLKVDSVGYLIGTDGVRGAWLPVGGYKVSVQNNGEVLSRAQFDLTADNTYSNPIDLALELPVPVATPGDLVQTVQQEAAAAALSAQQALQALAAAQAVLEAVRGVQALVEAARDQAVAAAARAEQAAQTGVPALAPVVVSSSTTGSVFEATVRAYPAAVSAAEHASDLGQIQYKHGDANYPDYDTWLDAGQPGDVAAGITVYGWPDGATHTATVRFSYVSGPRAGQTAEIEITYAFTASTEDPPASSATYPRPDLYPAPTLFPATV